MHSPLKLTTETGAHSAELAGACRRGVRTRESRKEEMRCESGRRRANEWAQRGPAEDISSNRVPYKSDVTCAAGIGGQGISVPRRVAGGPGSVPWKGSAAVRRAAGSAFPFECARFSVLVLVLPVPAACHQRLPARPVGGAPPNLPAAPPLSFDPD